MWFSTCTSHAVKNKIRSMIIINIISASMYYSMSGRNDVIVCNAKYAFSDTFANTIYGLNPCPYFQKHGNEYSSGRWYRRRQCANVLIW